MAEDKYAKCSNTKQNKLMIYMCFVLYLFFYSKAQISLSGFFVTSLKHAYSMLISEHITLLHSSIMVLLYIFK